MGKKRKDPLIPENSEVDVKSKESSSSSTVFNALFGEVREQSSTNSLFSESNPFRRKRVESQLQNPEVRLEDKDAKEEKVGSLEISRQDTCQKVDATRESSEPETEVEKKKKKKFKGLHSEMDEKESKEEEVSNVTGNGDKKKRKKRKREELEAEYEAKHYGVAIDAEKNVEKNTLAGRKRKKIDNPEDMMVPKEGFDDESKLRRTIFVGNLPLKLKKKEILKEFEKFGEVESVRIRSVPLVDGKMPRKGAAIKKIFNENGNSVHSYIVFKTEESAQASLAHNMAVVHGNHIRVDMACPPRKKLKGDVSALYDKKRTVFVGNLPFDVKDEEIYGLFSSLKNLETTTEAVRVIRDPASSLGKGIAYVLFKTTDAANLAAKKRNLKIRDRELRLSHAKSTASSSSKRNSSSQTEINSSHPAKRSSQRTPDNRSGGNKMKFKPDLSYQGVRASKSGSQPKVHRQKHHRTPARARSPPVSTPGSWKRKRPAVATRKEKTQQVASGGGSKRKLGDRTPQSSAVKKKARRFQ